MSRRVGKYEIGQTLGQGSFAKVKYALDTETKEAVAIKILDKEKIQALGMGEQVKREIAVMKMVKHQHVVNLLEVLASRTKIFIVLELVTGGELYDVIRRSGKLSEPKARHYFRQLISGVEYCHRQGVCHRDLKPENMLLDEQARLKISDFGLSALNDADEPGDGVRLKTACGSPQYVAPEVLRQGLHETETAIRSEGRGPSSDGEREKERRSSVGYDGFMADVWSCGVLLYVLLAGFLPFDAPDLFRKIYRAEYSCPSWFSAGARALLGGILVAQAGDRWSIAAIKRSEWFLEGGYEEEEEGERHGEWSGFTDAEDSMEDLDGFAAGAASCSASCAASCSGLVESQTLLQTPRWLEELEGEGRVRGGAEPSCESEAARGRAEGGRAEGGRAEGGRGTLLGRGGVPAGDGLTKGLLKGAGDKADDKAGALQPPSIDAFELIALCGGLSLSLADEGEAKLQKRTRFHSQAPPLLILERICAELCAHSPAVEHRLFDRAFKIRATYPSERSNLRMTIQLWSIAEGTTLVDWRLTSGDALAFRRLYHAIGLQLSDITSM